MKKNSVQRFLSTLSLEQKRLRKEILMISHAAKVSHLGSCLSAVDIIAAVYACKRPNDIFVLSSGHAAVALYAVLNKKMKKTVFSLQTEHIHPDRNLKKGIYVSTGSLGQGLPIALGMAFADKKKKIFCLVSDGECSEGSIWEALRIAEEHTLSNLVIIINMNGYGAYKKVHIPSLTKQLKGFIQRITTVNGHDLLALKQAIKQKKTTPHVIIAKTVLAQLPFLKGQDAHYKIMSDEDFRTAQALLQ